MIWGISVKRSCRLTLLLFIIYLTAVYSLAQQPQSSSSTYRGDINEDGRIDIFDLIELLQALRRPDVNTSRALQIADIDASGALEIFDFLRLLKVISGAEKPEVIYWDPAITGLSTPSAAVYDTVRVYLTNFKDNVTADQCKAMIGGKVLEISDFVSDSLSVVIPYWFSGGTLTVIVAEDTTNSVSLSRLVRPESQIFTPALRDQALDWTAQSLIRTIQTVGDSFPVDTRNGVWRKDNGGGDGFVSWTGGFWAGMLWMMYRATGDSLWQSEAERYTALLEHNKDDFDNIDLGILFWPSLDWGYMITGNPHYREVGLQGARSLLKRFNPAGGYFQCWGHLGDRSQARFVIIDALISLDHLFWATRESGDSSFASASVTHALKTVREQVRADGSSWQVVEYDYLSGVKLRSLTSQGYADSSTWSRGQSWGIYGFSRTSANTGDSRFLDAAVRMADWFIDHLPADYVPYWDFDAPVITDDDHDTSAASIAASGLIELAHQVKDPVLAAKYFEAAENILASLTKSYLTRDLPGGSDGVLTGGT